MHLDAVPPVLSVALVHLTEVRGLEAPITIGNRATDYFGVRHAGMLSCEWLVATASPPVPDADDDSDNYHNPQNSCDPGAKYLFIHRNRSHIPRVYSPPINLSSKWVCCNPPRILGDLMTNLLNMLHDERTSLVRKLAGVDAVIHALNGSAAPAKIGKKRTMSAAARAKISAAQKKRWAKARK